MWVRSEKLTNRSRRGGGEVSLHLTHEDGSRDSETVVPEFRVKCGQIRSLSGGDPLQRAGLTASTKERDSPIVRSVPLQQ